MDGIERIAAAIVQAQAEAARTVAEAAERTEQRRMQAQAEADERRERLEEERRQAAERRESEQRELFREELARRDRRDDEMRQARDRPWLMGLRADAVRSHELTHANRVLRFTQHLGAATRSQEYILGEMYDIWGDDEDRAFHRAASHLTWDDFCRAHNARLLKKRLDEDVNDAWANDWGPFSKMACPILFYEAEQVCPPAAEYNRAVLANRRASSCEQLPDPTGGAAAREVPSVTPPWTVPASQRKGKLRLRQATDPLGGEPWLQVVDTAGSVIGAVDMADVAAFSREADRRTNVLLEGTQEAHRRIAALEQQLAVQHQRTQETGVRRRAKSADGAASGLGAVTCYKCYQKGHMASHCPTKAARRAQASGVPLATSPAKPGTGF